MLERQLSAASLLLSGRAIVAAYLAYVELTLTEAVCGVVGDRNTVQQGSYARIFDIPISDSCVARRAGLVVPVTWLALTLPL